MKIHFWKMHGAGNDFIVVDDRELRFPLHDAEWLRWLMDRRRGVGAEGLLLLQPSERAHIRMRFINPDGREVEMCGNGARCLARLAWELGAAPEAMAIETGAGIVHAWIRGGQVRLAMTPPRDWRMNLRLEAAGRTWLAHYVNSGVPHVVVAVDDLDGLDVREVGRAIRYHDAFAPAGTNANFIHIVGPRELRIRTYERGVEDETLACGTGIVASALIAGRLGHVHPPVSVRTAGGDVLQVDYVPTPDGARDVMLQGPAEHVYEGTVSYPQ